MRTVRSLGWVLASALIVTLPMAGCSSEDSATAPLPTSSAGGGAQGGAAGSGGQGATTSSTTTAGGSGGGGGGGGGFALEVHTELDGPSLVLHCNLPRDAEVCASTAPPDAPCADVDGDGLTDAWEELAIDRYRPFVRYDENEEVVGDPGCATAMVARVAPVGDFVHLYMMLGYCRDYGSCGGLSAHNGDSERVALELAPVDEESACDVQVVRAYTAAHEGTATDHGQIFDADTLDELTHAFDPDLDEPRWVVFSSEGKHATYASVSICEGISQVPCLDEDCDADGVTDPSAYEELFAFVNAGEESAPFVTDLTAIGFDGEDAWADQDFCGGLGGIGCASSVRSKLLDSPF